MGCNSNEVVSLPKTVGKPALRDILLVEQNYNVRFFEFSKPQDEFIMVKTYNIKERLLMSKGCVCGCNSGGIIPCDQWGMPDKKIGTVDYQKLESLFNHSQR